MLTYATTVLAANKRPRGARRARPSAGRGRAERHQRDPVAGSPPGSTPAAPIDATPCDAVVAERRRAGRAVRAGIEESWTAESRVRRRRCAARPAPACSATAPVLPTGAGHDAGILAAAGVPTAMLFVRNPTGVSHSPGEHAETADCLAGVEALAARARELAG